MFASRNLLLCRTIGGIVKNSNKIKSQQILPIRNHGSWNYRCAPPPPAKHVKYLAEGVGAFMWWWVLVHLWYEPGHVFGEWDYPDPLKWTDQELGIPPDDVE